MNHLQRLSSASAQPSSPIIRNSELVVALHPNPHPVEVQSSGRGDARRHPFYPQPPRPADPKLLEST